MKTLISKVLIAGAIITTFSLNLQAGPIKSMAADTGKMGKMGKMEKKPAQKMSKKMAPKKMAKDTGKMSKM